jgi:exodeoxyribonuclease III
MRIISWNVNGIRSVFNKGFLEWITKESPDILCIQETKAQPDQFPKEILELKQYEIYHSYAHKKGYSGVTTFSKKKFLDTKKSNIEAFDSEGRVLIHEADHFFLVNSYFPHGQRDHQRIPFKLEFCQEMQKILTRLKNKKPVIITGDFNISHKEIDIANPKGNKNTSGFLPEERSWMDHFVDQGWIDTFRHLHPEQSGAYTWWSKLNPSIRERNIGWRLDYFFISPDLHSHLKSAEILSEIKGSDHCPVLLELKNLKF